MTVTRFSQVPWADPEVGRLVDELWTRIIEQPAGFRGDIDRCLDTLREMLPQMDIVDAAHVWLQFSEVKDYWERWRLDQGQPESFH